MNLNIAQFTFGLELAGQERVVVDLAKAFRERGCNSLVCTTLFGGQLANELEAASLPFKCLGLRKSYAPHAIVSVMRYLRENSIDAVITHGSSGCLVPRIAAIMERIPAIIHVEHNVSDFKKSYHIVADRLLSRHTDKIVCISENAKESLVRIEKTIPDKVTVIPNGLDTNRFSVRNGGRPAVNQIKRIGMIGRFAEQKGHSYFLKAASELVKVEKDIEFVFIGDGPLRPEIEAKVGELGLQNYCKFLGLRSDACDLLQTFDIFVLSSLWEGLPITLLEAQYFGVASVATDVGGNAEVIRNGYNGLLVPPRDPWALASALRRLLLDEELRKRFSLRGKEIFEEKFSGRRMTDAYLGLIESIFQTKKTGVRNNA
jgi:glycosyltransferase involved in cell wall biosynthesis